MPTVTTYRPTPLVLPPDASLTRTFVDPRSHRGGEPPLGEEDLERYERHTIFHDVFLGDGELRALGPPLANLAAVVRPLRCRLLHPDGSASPPLPHRLERRERCTLHRFRLPPARRGTEALRARVELASGQRSEIDVARATLPDVFLQFATLQKDNPFEWIADWLVHAARLGVERVLLYDNGSADAETLPGRLRTLRHVPDVMLVHWPFPYGPARSHYNQFAQASQNNHAHLCFGGAEWHGHFDIDEYLVTGEGRSLVGCLRRLPTRVGLLRLDSWWAPRVTVPSSGRGDGSVPGTARGTTHGAAHGAAHGAEGEAQVGAQGGVAGDPTEADLPTVRDFPHRERQARGRAHKYLVRGRALKAARVHNARLRLGWLRWRPPPERLGFVHYLTLNNGWKGERGAAVPFDPARHVEEHRVIDALAACAPPSRPPAPASPRASADTADQPSSRTGSSSSR